MDWAQPSHNFLTMCTALARSWPPVARRDEFVPEGLEQHAAEKEEDVDLARHSLGCVPWLLDGDTAATE